MQGYHPLGWAVLANRTDVVALLLGRKADINYRTAKGETALYMAIMHLPDGSEMVRFLLSHAAKATASAVCPSKVDFETPEVDDRLTVTMRYWLKRAAHIGPLTKRRVEVMDLLSCSSLRRLDFSLIGQRLASSLLTENTILFRAMGSTKTKPLVLLFAGPPGHGKTVLAQQYGEALLPPGAAFIKIDCASNATQQDLFGSGRGYLDSKEGSALNNFMSANDGKASIVLLDEFERMPSVAHEGLLNPFDKGEWHEKRPSQSRTVNCANTIFILTTNILDPDINSFFRSRPEALQTTDIPSLRRLECELDDVLRPLLVNKFSGPLARRIDNIIPFVPFNPEERLVLADCTLRAQCALYRSPPNHDRKKFIGDLNIRFTMDVVKRIAARYTPQTGASSIHQAMAALVERPVTMMWADYGDRCGPTDMRWLSILIPGGPVTVTDRRQAALAEADGEGDAKGDSEGDIEDDVEGDEDAEGVD